jgi:hypothetical protein
LSQLIKVSNLKKTSNVSNISVGILIAEVNYSSIEIPVSLRHCLFLNNNSKIFINASYIFDFSSKSSIEFKRSDNSNLSANLCKYSSPRLLNTI